MPDKSQFFKNDLLQQGVIALDHKMTSSSVAWFGQAMMLLQRQDVYKEITLYIISIGGEVSASLDIYDMVVCSRKPVTGIVHSYANSMAAVVLQGCIWRGAYDNAQITIHDNIIEMRGSILEIERKWRSVLDRNRPEQMKVYEILSKRTKKSLNDIMKKCEEGLPMYAEEAFEFGLIDEIIKPK